MCCRWFFRGLSWISEYLPGGKTCDFFLLGSGFSLVFQFGHPSLFGISWADPNLLGLTMVVSFKRSIDIDCRGLPEGMSFSDVMPLILSFFEAESQYGIAAVQACPGRVARVTFVEGGEAAKAIFEDRGVVVLGEVECRVVQPPPPPPGVNGGGLLVPF